MKLLHADRKAQFTRRSGFTAARLLLLVCLVNFACTKAQRTSTANNRGASTDTATLVESLITSLDKDGTPTEVVGYTENASLNIDSKITTESFLPERSKGEKAFEFIPPEGYDSEFSEPVPISGSFLAGNSSYTDCESLAYQAEEPTFGDVLTFMQTKKLCSDISFNFCVKLTAINKPGKAFYFKTPRMDINLLCPTEAFVNIDFTINGGDTSTSESKVDVNMASKPVVTSMYITNSSDCASGGSWESSKPVKKAWTLAPIAGVATVYGRFRDILGNTSECLSASISIIHDSQSPTATSISINTGATYATSTSATLTLAATGASEMYITNTAACGSGGTWEAYAVSPSWTLGQTNATATVYVKYRDAAGNETSCLDDTITHDDQAPTGESISISSGATYTTSSSVTVGLAATGASEMYITNTSGCGSGGSWEAYDTTKASWELGQINTTATVYAKYRDGALNETACTPDSIVHDGVAPSNPTSFIDGNTTSSISTSPTLFWSASTDGGSGIADYEVAIGTSAGDSDVKDWTSVGNVVSASVSGLLTMVESTNYYASIRALDAAGNSSAVVNGDGFTLIQWRQQAYIKASNADSSNYFGGSVALSSDTLAVGNDWESSNQATITNGTSSSTDNSSSASGAVYVYKRTGSSWAQEAYIKASNNNSADYFGMNVALAGDSLAVGAHHESSNQTTITNGTTSSTDNSQTNSGAVYVYKRTGSSWAQEAYIKASNRDAGDLFGFSLGLSDDILAVGANYEYSNQTTITNGTTSSTDNSRTNSGAVYVYQRTGSSWAQEAYIKTSTNVGWSFFGTILALSADTLAVGVYNDASNQTTITNGTSSSTDNSNNGSGAVYVYKRTGSNWAQEAYIKASNSNASDDFSRSIALSTDTLAVGSDRESSNQTTITNGTLASTDNTNTNSGAVYVYKRTANSWMQEAYIKASNNDGNDYFGKQIALSGDTITVGVSSEDSTQTTITNGTSANTDNSNAESGAVYVYRRTGSNWAQEAYIKASNSDGADYFGVCIALSGDTLAIGASGEDGNQTTITNGTSSSTDNSSADSGAVYIYTR